MKRPAVLLIPVLVVGLLVCGLVAWLVLFGSVCAFPDGSPSKCARKVGFEPVAGTEIHDAKSSGWQDSTTTFRLVGSPEAIDNALEAADFDERLVADNAGPRFEDDVDLDAMTGIQYGEDQWHGPHGVRDRRVLRATLPGDGSEQVLFVHAG